MSINQNFPEVYPSLNLDFANSKTLDPRITFERSSIGTYVDEDGLIKTAAADEARFDYDPETGESLGLLIEESRVNYYIYSGNLSNNYWNHSNLLITANSTTSPDGSITATLLVPNTTSAIHRITPNLGVTTSYNTVSFFVKSAGYRYIMVRGDNQSNFNTFDIIDGIITGQSSLNSSIASIQDYNNGWYRCVLSYVPATTANDPEIFFANTSDYNAANFSGNGIDGAYFWGAQLEQGSFPTSYIPTSGSSVTRSADTARITGSNYSLFFDDHPTGTLFSKYSRAYDFSSSPNTKRVWTFYRGTTNNNVQIRSDGSSNEAFYLVDGGTTSIAGTRTVPGKDTTIKSAAAWDTSTASVSFDGALDSINLTSNLPFNLALLDFSIGSYAAYSSTYLCGHIKQIVYYPSKLSDSELQNLTK